jgi:hypothetical protein
MPRLFMSRTSMSRLSAPSASTRGNFSPRLRGLRPKLAAVALVVSAGLLAPTFAWASDVGEEVEVTSASVTALSCALEAKKTGKLDVLSSCPLSEVSHGIVVFDVAERAIYRLAEGKVFRYELEKAIGGGSIDFEGKVVRAQDGLPVVEVAQYSITAKKKPGSFKGCL